MPPRRRVCSGYHGVRERPSDAYYAKIRSGDVRLSLDMFETSHEAARAYDAAAWRLGRPRAQMNFQDVYTPDHAQDLAPPPRLITDHCEVANNGGTSFFGSDDERWDDIWLDTSDTEDDDDDEEDDRE
ncbi:putative AP2 protein [Hordeum vulgare]|nr:putative AP2 protein [Hordeum vulgare]